MQIVRHRLSYLFILSGSIVSTGSSSYVSSYTNRILAAPDGGERWRRSGYGVSARTGSEKSRGYAHQNRHDVLMINVVVSGQGTHGRSAISRRSSLWRRLLSVV